MCGGPPQLDTPILCSSSSRCLEQRHPCGHRSLWGNKLSGSVPNAIGAIKSLSELWLRHNQISGFEDGFCDSLPDWRKGRTRLDGDGVWWNINWRVWLTPGSPVRAALPSAGVAARARQPD